MEKEGEKRRKKEREAKNGKKEENVGRKMRGKRHFQ